jgi:hypothetical protein
MAASSVAGIITATSTVLIAAGGVIAALTLFLPVLRGTKQNAKAIEEVKVASAEIHTIVNQQRTDMGNYNRALIRALQDQGIAVPIDQSVKTPPQGFPASPPAVPAE